MKTTNAVLTLLILVLCLPLTSAPAADDDTNHTNGEISDGGKGQFTFRDGLWWDAAGLSYSRESEAYTVTPKAVYGCSVCAAPYTAYRWSYTRVIVKTNTPYVNNTIISYTPDWKQKVLEIAAKRDDYNSFLAALNALGYQQQQSVGGYPTGGASTLSQYTTSNSLQLGSYGANATTGYGYTLKEALGGYFGDSPGVLFQAASQHVKNAQQLAGQGATDFSDLVKQDGSYRARVAEILARGQVAAAALQAASGPPQTVTQSRTFTFQVVPNDQGGYQVVPAQSPQGAVPNMPTVDDAVVMTRVLGPRCAGCHSGKDPQAGLDLSQYSSFTAEQRGRVWARLTHKDPEKRMPKGPNNTIGQPLPPEELAAVAQTLMPTNH